jgi:hypothetical protein
MDGVEFPRRDAEAILKKTMLAAGYSKQLADVGVWSALWLEDRFESGVTNLIVYLCLIKDRRFDDLQPRRHPEFRIGGVCPFMLAAAIIDLSAKWLPRGGVAFGAPADPFLMMASIADWASTKDKSVRFRYLNYSCLMSNDGIDVEGDDLSMVGWIDPDNDRPIMIELTDDRPPSGVRQVERLSLPAARVRGRDALDLN